MKNGTLYREKRARGILLKAFVPHSTPQEDDVTDNRILLESTYFIKILRVAVCSMNIHPNLTEMVILTSESIYINICVYLNDVVVFIDRCKFNLSLNVIEFPVLFCICLND